MRWSPKLTLDHNDRYLDQTTYARLREGHESSTSHLPIISDIFLRISSKSIEELHEFEKINKLMTLLWCQNICSLRFVPPTPRFSNCKEVLMFKSSKSLIAFLVSLSFWSMMSNVLSRFSHIFFSMVKTYKLCFNVNSDKYGNS